MEPVVEFELANREGTKRHKKEATKLPQVFYRKSAASVTTVDINSCADDQTVPYITTVEATDCANNQSAAKMIAVDAEYHDDQTVPKIPSVGIVNNTAMRLTDCIDIGIGVTYKQQVRYGAEVIKGVPLRTFLGQIIKNSSVMERITCAFIALSLLFSILVVVYHFVSLNKRRIADDDPAAPEWFVSREVWNALPCNTSVPLSFKPIQLVIIQHSVSHPCYTHVHCMVAMLGLQKIFLEDHSNADIPYNFQVGNDGRIYEGRGWENVSLTGRWLNRCVISIGFIGDYRYIKPTFQQLNRTRILLEQGVHEGYLDPNYALVGAKDIISTESPGTYLQEAIQEFKHYLPKNHFRFMACEQIHQKDNNPFIDNAPHEWFITKENWGGEGFDDSNSTLSYNPLKLVIVDNFETRDCYVFVVCKSELQNLQGTFMLSNKSIHYNFVVGNDGRVYEARGWGVEGGEESLQFQPCALTIGFLGNYTDYDSPMQAKVTPAQINRTKMLLEEAVRKQYLDPKYLLVGAKDILHENNGPGENLYYEIQSWDHYDSEHLLNTESNCNSLL